jgi:hypothetical protein
MIGVNTDHELSLIVIVRELLKFFRVQTQMYKNCASIVHGYHANTLLVKNEGHLYKNTLQSFRQCANSARLDSLRFNDELWHFIHSKFVRLKWFWPFRDSESCVLSNYTNRPLFPKMLTGATLQ